MSIFRKHRATGGTYCLLTQESMKPDYMLSSMKLRNCTNFKKNVMLNGREKINRSVRTTAESVPINLNSLYRGSHRMVMAQRSGIDSKIGIYMGPGRWNNHIMARVNHQESKGATCDSTEYIHLQKSNRLPTAQ
jgi:hypothetical protein